MLRINLLPVKAEAKRELGQRQLVLFSLILLVFLVGLYFFNELKSGEVKDQEDEVNALRSRITKLEAEVKDGEKFASLRRSLLIQKAIFVDLHSRRSGPAKMMRELGLLMSPGRGPGSGWSISEEEYEEIVRTRPGLEINPTWDPTRLWLASFKEEERLVTFVGKAKSNDDVAEIHKRLTLSKFFYDVEFGPITTEAAKEGVSRSVTFTLTAAIDYSPVEKSTGDRDRDDDKGDDKKKDGDDGDGKNPFKPTAPDKVE